MIKDENKYLIEVGSVLKKQPPVLDCVSRQAAIDAFEDTTFTKNEILRRLSELPSAQPEIIRCKDCYHYPGEHTDCPLIGWGRNENDFCSYAERRTNE